MRHTLAKFTFPCICALVFLTSCVTDVASRYYADRKYAPNPVEKVEILRGRPSKPFDVIADFQSRGESFQSMRKRAAEIGGDAVIITSSIRANQQEIL